MRSASETAAAVSSGAVSALEVLDDHVTRIDRLNPELNAIVVPDLERAHAAAAAGPRGPLAGVPFTVKEAISVEGLPACEASLLRPREVAAADATVVARLRAAGAIVLGTTNTSELCAHPDSSNRVYGATLNPLEPSRSAGGSSGGEAAAVRAGLSAFGIGSDYGGSIRAPAHYCGIAGIRPGVGRVPTEGHLPHVQPRWRQAWSTIGPLARSVDDLALVLGVLAGERLDDGAIPAGVAIYHDALDRPVAPECLAAVRIAAAALPGPVEEVEPPFQRAAEEVYERISAAETRSIIESLGPLDEASPQLLAIWGAVREARPLAPGAADDVRMVEAAAADWLERHPVLLAPAAANVACPSGTLDLALFDDFHHCKLASALGLPAAVVPVTTTAEGMPVGVQVIGRRGREDEVLAVCRAIEEQVAGA